MPSSTLCPSEKPRKLLDVEILPEQEKPVLTTPEDEALSVCPLCSMRLGVEDDLRGHLYDHSKTQMIDALLDLLLVEA